MDRPGKDWNRRKFVSRSWCVLYRRITQPTLLAAGALWAIVLAHPGTARAECGDYMLRPANVATVVTDTHAVAHRSPFRNAPAIPREPAAPCHGAHCSRGVPTPALPVTAQPAPKTDWACVLCCKVTFANVVARYLVGPFCLLQARHVLAIYHPPRHS